MLGNYSVACVEAEIASQLFLKSVIAALGYEVPRTHSVRELIGFIVSRLPNEYSELISRLREFTRAFRRELIILEDCRGLGQYGDVLIDKDRAEIAVDVAKKIRELSDLIWEVIKS